MGASGSVMVGKDDAGSDDFTETPTFSLQGVPLSSLNDFITACGGRDSLLYMTTQEVCNEIIRPATAFTRCSYRDILISQGVACAPANVYIIHTWRSAFLDVVDALLLQFKAASDTMIWLDLFCINQHKLSTLPAKWLTETLTIGMSTIAHSVLVVTLDPTTTTTTSTTTSSSHSSRLNLLPLSRAWCLLEIHCSSAVNASFDVAMPLPHREILQTELLRDVKALLASVDSQVDLEKSESTRSEDKESILQAVRDEGVGLSVLNTTVRDKMKLWMAQITANSIMNNSPPPPPTSSSSSSSSSSFSPSSAGSSTIPDRLSAVKTMSSLFLSANKVTEAEPLCLETLQLTLATVGPTHPDTILARLNLAEVYSLGGRYSEAETHLQQVLSVLRSSSVSPSGSSSGSSSSSSSSSSSGGGGGGGISSSEQANIVQLCDVLFRLAIVKSKQTNFAAAQPLLTECVVKRKASLGADDVATLDALAALGNCLVSLGSDTVAEPILVKCLERKIRVLGPTHSSTLDSLLSLAQFHLYTGSVDMAEPLLSQYLDKKKSTVGLHHPDTIKVMHQLAQVLKKQRKLSAAADQLRTCLQLRRTVLGDVHEDTLETMNVLAGVYRDRGRHEEAEPLFVECLAGRRAVFGDDHHDTLQAQANLASHYVTRQRFDVAEQLLVECLRRRRAVLGSDHEDTLWTMNNLAVLYLHLDRAAEAEAVGEECLQRSRAVLGPQDPDTVKVLFTMASVYKSTLKLRQAEVLYSEFLDVLRTVLGPDHPDTREAEKNLLVVSTLASKAV